MVVVRNSRVDDAADPVPSNGGNLSDATSCISSAEDAGESGVKSDGEPSTARQRFPYYSTYGDRGCCYHPGRDATFGGIENRAHYASGDKAGIQYPAIQSENGALIYFMQGIHPGYNSYNPYLPITMVADGQYVQQFYSPYMMLQPSIASPGYLPSPLPCGESVPSTGLWSPSLLVADGAYENGYTGMMEIPGPKVNMSSPSKSSLQMLDISSGHGMHNQLKHVSKAVSTFQSEPVGKGYFPVAKLPFHAQGKGGVVHPNGHVKANAGVWSNSEKPKAKSKINSTTESGLFNEQNHGPRETDAKSCLTFESNAAGSFGIDGNGNSDSIISVIRRDQYNLSDFSTKFDQGFFFVIKSYSEDDVHKSIKYNVWASTPNGNKRLDGAYQEAQEKIAVESSKCPVFLFFSVNASGQFCGVAEMIGRVDFNKKLNFWQQDKWNGCFPVKWHILKDVPNPRLRHIILENNEHKPVTNSRDTQEVQFNQGVEMLNIFKTYVSKTSILDDFDFYESRQRIMQEKRQRLWMLHDHIQQKADEITTDFGSLDIIGEKMENGHQANE